MNNDNLKIVLMKYGDPESEFRGYLGENYEIYGPTWDYIAQYYKECKELLDERSIRTYWIGFGSCYKVKYKKNNVFITLNYKNLLGRIINNFLIFYYLIKINPDIIINIVRNISSLTLYFYQKFRINTKIYQFLAGEITEKSFFSNLLVKILKTQEGIYVMNSDSQNFLKRKLNRDVKRFFPLYTEQFYNTNINKKVTNDNEFNIFYCGRFSEEKGIWDLLEIIHRVDDENIRFHLMGSGNELKHFEKEMEKRKLFSKVKFYGYVPHKELYNYLKQADIGIIPSQTEGLCQVAVEFLLSKVPVLATNTGGLKDLIKNEKNGFLINKNHKVSGFIDRIKYLKNNPMVLCRLKNNISSSSFLYQQNTFGKIVEHIITRKMREEKKKKQYMALKNITMLWKKNNKQ